MNDRFRRPRSTAVVDNIDCSIRFQTRLACVLRGVDAPGLCHCSCRSDGHLGKVNHAHFSNQLTWSMTLLIPSSKS